MPDAPLPMLVTLQAGALMGLSVWFGLEALRRKDGTVVWMAGAAAATALAAVLEQGAVGLGVRLAGFVSAMGQLFLLQAFLRAYPAHLPRWMPLVLALALAPGVLIQGAGILVPTLLRGLWWAGQVLVGAVVLGCLWELQRLKEKGDCDVPGVMPLAWAACVLLLAHALARPYIGALLGLDHSGLLLLLLALASCHLKDLGRHEHVRAEHLEAEVGAWRGLLDGPSWRTGESADAMVASFGKGWAARGEVLTDRDGQPHRLHRKVFLEGAEVGWAQPLVPASREVVEPFLLGWVVGLGLDEGPEYDVLKAWLEAWGGLVIPVGTVPPREAPYPNVFLWAREPSILAVWRELDLPRRRCRWVQIGLTDLEGPHALLPTDYSEKDVRDALRSLVSPEGREGSGLP